MVFAVFLGVPAVQTVQYSLYDWNGIGRPPGSGCELRRRVHRPGAARRVPARRGADLLLRGHPDRVALFLTSIISRARPCEGCRSSGRCCSCPRSSPPSWWRPSGSRSTPRRAVQPDAAPGRAGRRSPGRGWATSTALFAIGLIGTWLGIGLCLVLFLTGVATSSRSCSRRPGIDGAGRLREFFSITLPALRGQIAVALTLTVVAALKTFDLVYITTRGGPGNGTTVPAFEAYNRAFNTGQVGSAAAVAILLTVVILVDHGADPDDSSRRTPNVRISHAREKVRSTTSCCRLRLIAVIPLVGVVLSAVTPTDDRSGGFRMPYARSTSATSSTAWSGALLQLHALQPHRHGVGGRADRRPGHARGLRVRPAWSSPARTCCSTCCCSGLLLPAEAFIIPLYYNLRTVGLTDTYWALHPAADRAVAGLRDLLDAQPVPRRSRARSSRPPGSTARGLAAAVADRRPAVGPAPIITMCLLVACGPGTSS